uniref:Uncharacterized protein n=1 Tax=Sphaerisporangium sp. SANK 60911 TaxID=1354075 RepID=V5YSC0_9ACTN|nr:hypothetical protein [Sphaerisporangium sp. SANK 60911]
MYDSHLAYRAAARWTALLESPRRSSLPPGEDGRVRVSVEGEPPAAPFAVTTSKGLFLWRGDELRHLVPGPTFGLTVGPDGTLYVFQQTGHHGRVLRVRHDEETAKVSTWIWGLSRWVHQIDFVGEHLLVTDTWRNRVLAYRALPGVRRLHASRPDWTLFVGEDSRDGRFSPGYHHVNSVYRHGDLLYVMAHNHSLHTGRESEIWTFGPGRGLAGVEPTRGRCCHNVVLRDGKLMFCRSLEGTLAYDGADVFTTDGFTRGLSVTEDAVLVGVSRFAEDPARRDADGASVEVLDRDFTWRGRIGLYGCQIRDIRSLPYDLGLSNVSDPHLNASGNR